MNPSDHQPVVMRAARPVMVNLRLRMSVENAETLSGLLDGTAGGCEDAALRAMCSRTANRIDAQVTEQAGSPPPPAAAFPEEPVTIPHYVARLAFQLAVSAQEASGNANTPLTTDLRKALELLEGEPAALIG